MSEEIISCEEVKRFAELGVTEWNQNRIEAELYNLINQKVDFACQNWKRRDLKLQSLLTQRDKEIAEFRKDKERLDWLNKLFAAGDDWIEIQLGRSDLRNAVDAAMSKDAKCPTCNMKENEICSDGFHVKDAKGNPCT